MDNAYKQQLLNNSHTKMRNFSWSENSIKKKKKKPTLGPSPTHPIHFEHFCDTYSLTRLCVHFKKYCTLSFLLLLATADSNLASLQLFFGVNGNWRDWKTLGLWVDFIIILFCHLFWILGLNFVLMWCRVWGLRGYRHPVKAQVY